MTEGTPTVYTRRVRRSVTRGMKGEYSSETTVEVTYTDDAHPVADDVAADIARVVMEAADANNRHEIARRKALDAQEAP